MSLVTITQVEVRPAHPQIQGWNIDGPVSGATSDSHAVDIHGWAIGRESAVEWLEIVANGRLVRRVAPTVSRRDLDAAYPSDQARMGFRTSLGLLGLGNPTWRLDLFVRLAGGPRIPLGSISGTRPSVSSKFEPRVNPLLLTTFGRSGSTWFSYLLSLHPSIFYYRPFTYENRAITYWMSVLAELSDPGSYLKAVRSTDFRGPSWWLHDTALVQETVVPEIAATLGGEQVEAIVAFCQGRIEQLYAGIAPAPLEAKEYFVEKVPSGGIPDLVREVYPESKEILLVRDFRDVVCSALAFNKRRGVTSFGRQLVASDEEYIRKMRESGIGLLTHWRQRESDIMLVRYEELILQPKSVLGSVCRSLAVEDSDDMIISILEEAAVTTAGMTAHRTTPDSLSSVGRWRVDMTDEQKSIASESLGEVLEAFGYDPDVS